MYDCIIIGAGPAGLMAAVQAKGQKLLIIEKNSKPGKKLLITGGGRCNLTNLKSNQDFLNTVNYNKKYLYSAINKFGPYDIYDYFENNGVPLKEEVDNQIFPISNKAIDVLNALLKNITAEFKYEESVIKIKNGDIKEVMTDKGRYQAKKIIIATGGVSYPETGSSGDHLTFAKDLNQPIKDLFPAEASIILKDNPELAGTAIKKVTIKYLKQKTHGNLMFTHKGLSGTAIMQMSEHIYLSDNKEIQIDLIPDLEVEEFNDLMTNFDQEKQLSSFLNTLFTKRFSEYLITKIGFNKLIKSINQIEIKRIGDLLKNLPFIVDKVEDIHKAYVTGGGIDMNYLDTTSMESKINPGIYFAGEALDIHGPIGGYNITLALSTGYLAGSHIKGDDQ